MNRRNFLHAAAAAVLCMPGLHGCGNPADDVAGAKVSPPAQTPVPAPAGGSAAPSPTPSATSPSPAVASLPAGAVALPIDPATSKVDFVGSKVTGKHEGGFKSFSGALAILPSKPEIARIDAQIAMDSVWSDNDKLTGHLKAPDFFDVAKFPSSTFQSTEIKPGASDSKAKDATHTISGNLTLHGITKSIQFPAKLGATADSATLDSEFFINRKDFGIVYPGMANDLIRDEVVIKLVIRAKKA